MRNIMPALLIGALLSNPVGPASASAATDHPYLYRLGGEAQLHLTPAMQAGLTGSCANFKPWREKDFMPLIRKDYRVTWQQAPFAVVGDLNGDRRLDAAILGHTAKETMTIALMSRGQSYQCVVLEHSSPVTDPAQNDGKFIEGESTDDKGWGYYLSYVAPGKYNSSYEKKALNLSHAAFREDYYAKMTGIHYWNGKAFGWYVTAD